MFGGGIQIIQIHLLQVRVKSGLDVFILSFHPVILFSQQSFVNPAEKWKLQSYLQAKYTDWHDRQALSDTSRVFYQGQAMCLNQ